MKEHTWITEEVDGGSVGCGDFWICSECQASGGPVFSERKPWAPFYADGSGLKLHDDCEISEMMIKHHLLEKKK